MRVFKEAKRMTAPIGPSTLPLLLYTALGLQRAGQAAGSGELEGVFLRVLIRKLLLLYESGRRIVELRL